MCWKTFDLDFDYLIALFISLGLDFDVIDKYWFSNVSNNNDNDVYFFDN